ncbi:MAG TPA: hypothetical protein PKC38_03555 [Chitinophagales bacterium]|nr:hypothetical protein [Chitinophagales bacterium]HMU69054.1 hypothetical protein [Chitinophagales bacterium]HMX03364.1 hypothetical protein [Chitinophagales bacterium]HNJ88425.1 hypothetical protein [Chitinophagales bacterium]HNO28587.1 hypothetical protein [Chitinophagales bacterium]
MEYPFEQRYKNFSIDELLEVIQFPDDYVPEAVMAAKAELSLRQLTDEQLAEAQSVLDERKSQIRKKQELKQRQMEVVSDALDSIAREFIPGQTEPQRGDRLVKIIGIICSIMVLAALYQNRYLIQMVSRDGLMLVDAFASLLPLVIWIIAIIFFFMRKKAGWVMIGIIIAATAGLMIGQLILSPLAPEPFIQYTDSGQSNATLLLGTILVLALNYGLIRMEVREIFNVSTSLKNKIIITFSALGFLLAGVFILG